MKHTILSLTVAFLSATSWGVLAQSWNTQQWVSTMVCKVIGGNKNEDGACVYGNITFMPIKGKSACTLTIAPKQESMDKSIVFLHEKTCTELIKSAFPHINLSRE